MTPLPFVLKNMLTVGAILLTVVKLWVYVYSTILLITIKMDVAYLILMKSARFRSI
jgi:hypothetical protein